MFNPIQIILLILACHVIGTLGQNVQLVAKFGGQQVFRGLIAGFIMGDVKTGLLIGGTFQLMSMGLAAYGGASIPNFNTALWISVPFAIASGTDAPLELAMAVAFRSPRWAFSWTSLPRRSIPIGITALKNMSRNANTRNYTAIFSSANTASAAPL